MGLKAFLGKILAKQTAKKVARWSSNAIDEQEKTLKGLLSQAAKTKFARDHDFIDIKSYEQFSEKVPIRDYEGLRKYIDRVVKGESDVLWPGKPIYFSKTSGTTSGAKYIPITRESMGHHIEAARSALLLYVEQTGNNEFIDGKMIFLQGSPELSSKNGIKVGRLSGIVAHHVPSYLQKNRLPSFATNSIEDWETKVEAIINETVDKPMTLISGIPSWVQYYFERLIERTGKPTIEEIFPEFSLFVYGGVNFEPYRARFNKLIGKKIDSIETYPASEGFIAYQNDQKDPSLLLNTSAGIFYEFIPADRYFDDNPPRLSLADVVIGENYALVLSTNAGLWAYSIGDTVKFTSKDPHKILVTGRIKHFTSAFGEHVIAEEVEGALKEAIKKFDGVEVSEFTVAPYLDPPKGLPYHEWIIDFSSTPEDMDEFAGFLDTEMQKRNVYYADLIKGKILKPLEIRNVSKGAFNEYMKSKGKLGGQNKVPRLSNDRTLADGILQCSD